MDHVPPKLLLARPYPANLITVPACLRCNQSFQKDDEYTRTVISLDVRASKNCDVRSKLPAIMRSLQRPNAKAFLEYLASQTTASTILGHGGTPMGQVVDVYHARVNATGTRIIRALHFFETGEPLTRDAVVKVGAKAGLGPHEADTLEIARAFSKFSDRRDREIGRAFSYVAGFAPGMSVWMILMYEYFVWCGTVDSRAAKASALGPL